MFHSRYLILILLLSGCNWFKNNAGANFEAMPKIVPKNESKQNIKKILDNVWYQKVDITISENANYELILKSIANRLGIRIAFQIKEFKNISYTAQQKTFIEILSDISELNDWKISIQGKNVKLSPDLPYMHNYAIPFLTGERKIESSTSVMGNSSKENAFNIGSSAQLANTAVVDSFEELKKNLEQLASFEPEGSVKFFINKQAGVLSIFATQRVHKNIARYIELLKKNLNIQILVEAKIFEISLYERFEAGVDWSGFAKYINEAFQIPLNIDFDGSIGIITASSKTKVESPFNLVKFLYNFGSVKSVSNPRLIIGNNSVGIFKAVDNKVFFKLKNNMITNTNNKGAVVNSISSEVNTVPVGTIILVQPCVDENGRIMISLRPTISEVDEEVEDPAVSLWKQQKGNAVSSLIPVVKMRELDTVFTIDDDSFVIIGGLLYSKKNNNRSFFSFSSLANVSEKKEIVIFLRAKIISSYTDSFDSVYLN